MKYFYRILGTSLILSGAFLNEWVIKYLTHGQVEFATIEKRVCLAVIELLLVVMGILVLRYQKTVLQNVMLFFCAVMFSLGMVEMWLKYVPPNLDAEAPKWIPYQYKLQNRAFSRQHQARASLNPYGFNDKEHTRHKTPGITRIAILGDSFIWGSSVEDRVIWTHKLGRLLHQNGFHAEILNWGKPGWSTLDEYRFLQSEGIKYDFDLLLIGFTINDPVMDGSVHKRFIYEGGIIDKLLVMPISYLFPRATSLFVDLINGFFNNFFGYGYVNWLNKVYAEENLKRYEILLKDISRFCRDRQIRLLVVMTPENHNPLLQRRFEQIISLLNAAGISYVNLYPEVYRQLHQIPNRKLWANPADGHPGDRVTDVLAKGIYHYLNAHGFLNDRNPIKR